MNTSFEAVNEIAPPFQTGTTLRGKWNGNSYRIERLLGEGSNGRVYLVSRGPHQFALKLSTDAADLQSEVNALQALSNEPGSYRGFLIESDDAIGPDGGTYPFYVMKYVKGQQLQAFIAKRGKEWFPLVGLRLLARLRELHAKGWVFGDLKKENVLVSEHGEVELVDFGGLTPIGRSVKQFTELYDRGTWGGGSRKAEPSYDRFAFAILAIELCGNPQGTFTRQGLPQNRTVEFLWEDIREDPACKDYLPFLGRALEAQGHFANDEEAYDAWKELVRNGRQFHKVLSTRGGRGRVAAASAFWIPASFVLSMSFLAWVLFYYR